MEETKSIVGRIQNVGIGDLVTFSSRDYEIAGFVKRLNHKEVILSHENPLRPESKTARYSRRGYAVGDETIGDKKYPVHIFNKFEKLYDLENPPTLKEIVNNRLTEANIGDVVLLESLRDERQIGGFVIEKRDMFIALSHENPFKKMSGIYRKNPRLGAFCFSKGDKSYKIEGYSKYATLRNILSLESGNGKLNPVDDEEL